MKITIEIIPHEEQRLKMIGDWYYEPHKDDPTGHIIVRVTDLKDWRMIYILARHELDEAILCKQNGVTVKQVDEYDLANPRNGSSNFADNSTAPYYNEHNDALAAEWIMSRLLHVDWQEYEKKMAEYD